MKVVTWFGTRPEIIRLSRVIPALDAHCTQRLVHTGQNYDESLSDVFFRDLGVRAPDLHLGIAAKTVSTARSSVRKKRVIAAVVIVTGPPRAICSRKSGTTEPREATTLP